MPGPSASSGPAPGCAAGCSGGKYAPPASFTAQTDVWPRSELLDGAAGGQRRVAVYPARMPTRRIAPLVLLARLFYGVGRAQTSDVARWEPDIRAFEEADRAAPAPGEGILFVGSSSIRLWETLEHDFSGLPVVNRGFGGSRIRDVHAFLDRIVLPYRPRLIVFYCGTNDINAGRSVRRVVEDYRRFVRAVHEQLPQARIAFIAAAPNPARWHLRDQMQRLNREVQAWSRRDERLDYIDVWSAMLGPDGRPRPEIFVEDRLHMNERGYAIWARVVGEYLACEWAADRGGSLDSTLPRFDPHSRPCQGRPSR